jgi:NADPH:quinone reductase
MKAIVVEQSGGPEVLQIRDIPKPEPREGWVLVQIKAFGLNHSELITRRGGSPSVKFPRVIGIECVGIVEEAPGTSFQPGQKVASVMGGMGREFNGGYEEYALLPADHVFPINTDLPWEVFAALPESFLTAAGSLDAMDTRHGQTLLVRGATSSVGIAAIALGKKQGMTVLATTRNPQKVTTLREHGADHVIIDTGKIADDVKRLIPGGVNAVLELVGLSALPDSLQAIAPKGIACVAGALDNIWEIDHFTPMGSIPATVKLTSYGSGATNTTDSTPMLQNVADEVAAGHYNSGLDKVFHFHEIAEAHRYMEANHAKGKVVILVDTAEK